MIARHFRIGDCFRLPEAPQILTNSSSKTEIAVTSCRCDSAHHGRTAPIPQQDAWLIGLHVRACPDRDMWLEGKKVATKPLAEGACVIHDLRRSPVFDARSPFHAIYFHLTQRALDAIADDVIAPRISCLASTPGEGREDPVVRDLARLLLPAFEHPQETSRLFVDNVTLALCGHVAETYGGLTPRSRMARSGLASWQERRAKEILSANLEGDISVAVVADACGLSTSHFSRSFRQSTGVAPHQWLLQRRIDVAKTMLPNGRYSLSEISLACGFADQSHFTRVFSRTVGLGPGAWRRTQGPSTPPVSCQFEGQAAHLSGAP